MPVSTMSDIVITGLGISSAVGCGKDAFARGLFACSDPFSVMQREGRQSSSSAFLGAEIREDLVFDSCASLARRAGLSGKAALASVREAWRDACLDGCQPERIGLIIGGSNLTQRETLNAAVRYRDRPSFVSPSYALSAWDTDLCGLCSEAFCIRGPAYSLGGGSASGQLAVIHAADAVRSARVDVCIAVGALTDLSYLECQALRNVGAMGSDRHASAPGAACRPFDRSRDGFIYGEACGVLVVETAGGARRRGQRSYARIAGHACTLSGTRQPHPDVHGEVAAITTALRDAGLAPHDIDYVNPHGSGSIVGDRTELEALMACHLHHARLNATKSITGHGLSAAGAVELVATLIQMERGTLHPTRNLVEPEVAELHWVADQSVDHDIRHGLCLSYAFGGMNTAVCLSRTDN